MRPLQGPGRHLHKYVGDLYQLTYQWDIHNMTGKSVESRSLGWHHQHHHYCLPLTHLPSPDTPSAPVTMFVSRTTGTLARQTRHDCCPQSSMIRRGDITPFPLAGASAAPLASPPCQPPLSAPRRRTLRPSPAQPSPETCLPCSPRPLRWPPLDRAGTMVVLGADLVSTGVVKRLRACRGSVTSLIHRKTK